VGRVVMRRSFYYPLLKGDVQSIGDNKRSVQLFSCFPELLSWILGKSGKSPLCSHADARSRLLIWISRVKVIRGGNKPITTINIQPTSINTNRRSNTKYQTSNQQQ
jgi:hypothetical protein